MVGITRSKVIDLFLMRVSTMLLIDPLCWLNPRVSWLGQPSPSGKKHQRTAGCLERTATASGGTHFWWWNFVDKDSGTKTFFGAYVGPLYNTLQYIDRCLGYGISIMTLGNFFDICWGYSEGWIKKHWGFFFMTRLQHPSNNEQSQLKLPFGKHTKSYWTWPFIVDFSHQN